MTGSVLVLLEVGVEGEGEGVVVVEVTWRMEPAMRGARAADAIYRKESQRRMGRLDQFACILVEKRRDGRGEEEGHCLHTRVHACSCWHFIFLFSSF